jgi:hypothetical protein
MPSSQSDKSRLHAFTSSSIADMVSIFAWRRLTVASFSVAAWLSSSIEDVSFAFAYMNKKSLTQSVKLLFA